LLDLPADRRDPVKRSRPIACGALPIPAAIQLSTLLFLIALVMSGAFLPWSFTGWVALYLVLASVRSFWLYPFPIVNVIVLAALFSLRIPAGAAAAGLANPIGLQALCGGIYCVYALLKRQRRERSLA
jgi:4-hydroxybenzoate polyprenyltransferase